MIQKCCFMILTFGAYYFEKLFNYFELYFYDLSSCLTAPRGASSAAPDKFCALVSIDSVVWWINQSVELNYLRSLAVDFCLFLAVLGIFSLSWCCIA